MAFTSELVHRAVSPLPRDLSTDDAVRAIEIACLAVVSDGRIADEERGALLALRDLLGAPTLERLGGLVEESVGLVDRDARLERLRRVAEAITSEAARHLAYKLALVTSLADLAAADAEFEFDLDLQDALELDHDVADRLTGDVNQALALPE